MNSAPSVTKAANLMVVAEQSSAAMTLRMPPEWAPQDLLWIGFPHDGEEWPGYLSRAQEQIAGFANAVAESGQQVRLLVRDAANEARARELVGGKVTLERRSYGDIWLRDTGPLVVLDGGERKAVRFGFNGWGGKYLMPGDQTIGAELAADAGLPLETASWILEGGAVDGDGTGLAVTTEQCLLNPNRNPGLTREDIEQRLARDLGAGFRRGRLDDIAPRARAVRIAEDTFDEKRLHQGVFRRKRAKVVADQTLLQA